MFENVVMKNDGCQAAFSGAGLPEEWTPQASPSGSVRDVPISNHSQYSLKGIRTLPCSD